MSEDLDIDVNAAVKDGYGLKLSDFPLLKPNATFLEKLIKLILNIEGGQ